MTELDAAALRAAALSKLGAHDDARTARVVTEGVFAVELHVSEWEASSGRVVAHRVSVGVSADLLGALRGHPHVADQVTRIVGVAVSDRPGEAASDVVFHHDPLASAPIPSTPYRGVSPRDEIVAVNVLDLSALAYDYLTAAGEDDAAEIARRARIDVVTQLEKGRLHHAVRLLLAPEDTAAPRIRLMAIDRCLRDLLTQPSSVVSITLR